MESVEFEIIVSRTGPGRQIAVRGDLDLATIESLRPVLEDALESREETTLVLAECTFLDSSALKAIAETSRRADASGVAFTVARPSAQAARVLELSGLDGIVRIDAG